MVPLESFGAVCYSPSIVTKALSCISSEIKHNTGRSPSEYSHPIWYGKTRMVGLPDGEKTLRICITV